MAQPYPAWACINPEPPTIPQENVMWIEVLSPYYQTIRASMVESVKVTDSHCHDPRDRYRVIAIVGDREYVVEGHPTQYDAQGGAKNLQALLDNA